MKNIEQIIAALPSLDGKSRAALRKQVADCINGVSDMPERPDPDWQQLRRMAMQTRYERQPKPAAAVRVPCRPYTVNRVGRFFFDLNNTATSARFLHKFAPWERFLSLC